jgi:hypothetical protein
MTRALVWLCWGKRFVLEAAESARSAGTIEADRFLITDAAGAAHAKDKSEFTSIIPIELMYGNNLEKSRLIDFLPAGYETFLFLDTDTRIVGDVGLGFAKAERHGIALAPAPNYNLGEFFNFARIMRELGVEPADQIMYNSGVIFFHLTPAVRHVLERWRNLCATVGANKDFPRDQPFLTLALEQLGFTPYVLSPLYNYRSLGEHAVGSVRLWHSHFEEPLHLNHFNEAWPARRFVDGALMPADADAISRSPQGMLQLSLPGYAQRQPPEAAQSIAAQALDIQRKRGNRRANDFLIEQIGLGGSLDNDETYFAEALHFHLGLLHAYAGDPDRMAGHLRLSHTMPTGEDDQLFSDHVNVSHALRARQAGAIRRRMPPILIACMPRSASATLTHTIGRALDMPVLHVSAGQLPHYFLVPSWLDMFLEGGAITQDHFSASDFNVGVLRERGARDIFVLVRDPRAAARSQAHFDARGDDHPGRPLELRIERRCVEKLIPWLQAWIDCSRMKHLPFRIHWLTYREVCENPAAVLRRISGILADTYPAMAPYADIQKLEELRIHFVTGSDQAWQAEVGYETRERLWAACTPDIKSLLDLTW